jgi:hypothetical protein
VFVQTIAGNVELGIIRLEGILKRTGSGGAAIGLEQYFPNQDLK